MSKSGKYYIKNPLSSRTTFPCRVVGCDNPKLSNHLSFCRKHRSRSQSWGHPEAGYVRLKEANMFIPVVQQFFENHPDSKGLTLARKFFREHLPKSSRILRSPEFKWLGPALADSPRLANDTDTLIIRLAALILLDDNNRVFYNQDHQIRVMAKHLLQFSCVQMTNERNWKTGRVKKLTPGKQGRLLQTLGTAIWKPTGVFWLSVLRHIKQEQRLSKEWNVTMAKVT